MPRWVVTLLRLTPSVAFASGLSILGLVAFREVVPMSELAKSSNEIGNYLQTLGGIYAVLLAFVVFVVWGQFNEARTFIEREASAIVALHRPSSGLPRATRTLIQNGLREYPYAVLDEERTAMADGDEA